MHNLDSLLSSISEENDFEVKAAQGADGQGEAPRAMWESYSAMANTHGGTIVLGVDEQDDGDHIILGLKKPAKVRKQFWDGINNRQIVSANLLNDQDAVIHDYEGKSLLVIRVPRAERSERPIYVGPNPLTGTYRRSYEGDYKCDPDTVRRMLAEAIEPDRDSVLLENYGLDDLDITTLAACRNAFRSTKPNHPWLTLDDRELLRNLGGWKRDRSTGKEGLTQAGLLMFGRLNSILDALPNYVVDYQERPRLPTERRWLDRVTTDGTWSGNLYDFFRRVFPKLTSDLKVPFRTSSPGQRVDEDNIHEALREALVNSLIHADFSGRIPILIVKRPDFFGFRNPGELRLPINVVLTGGTSDCRNRGLQKMFQLVGAAEQAGSGFPKIQRAWGEQHWRPPLLSDGVDPDHTSLVLTMVSLLPQDVLDELYRRFGAKFQSLGETERLALATAFIETKVTNERLKSITDSHARDLTAMFRTLVDGDFLEPQGVGRGTCYFLPGTPSVGGDVIEHVPSVIPSSPEEMRNIVTDTSDHLEVSSDHLGLTSDHLNRTVGSSDPIKMIEAVAKPIRDAGKVSQTIMISAILILCRAEFMPLKKMAELLGRSDVTLRVHYLTELVRNGQLLLKYPDQPSHPGQAYRTANETVDNTPKDAAT